MIVTRDFLWYAANGVDQCCVPLSLVVDQIRKRKKELEEERLPEFAPPSAYYKDASQPKAAKVGLPQSNSGQEQQPLSYHSGSSTTEGPVSDVVKDDGSSGPSPPLPPQNQTVPQPTNYTGPYPYPPPNMLFFNQYRGPPHHIGPPPPPPHGPIPPYTGGQQPLYYYPYFHPPPPPSGIPPPSQPQQ